MNHADSAEPSGTCHADEALADFMQRLDRGEPVDRERFLADHPELADELRAYFAACDAVAEVAGGALPPTARLVYPTQPAAAWSPAPARSFGDYEVIEELARGGMGVIYKARQYVGTTLPRPYRLVALKMIRGGSAATPLEVRRFQREAEAVARLDHPHIVPVYEVGEYDGQHFFSMKLVEGGSLAEHLLDYRLPTVNARTGRDSEGKAWTPAEIETRKATLIALMAGVARAVHYAHQHGVLHRDLKPANILLDADGQPHVTDFGLAKRLPVPPPDEPTTDGRLTQSGLIVGTPNYMAPEQARGGAPPSTAADVHSLGAILYELLTGRPPFREATPLATLMKLLDAEPTPPRALNPLVDPDLETICLKSLRKEPRERYGSALELAEELERWRAGEPIRARPVGRIERSLKWARRRPAVAALTGACVALTLLSLIGGVWQLTRVLAAERRAAHTIYLQNIALAQHERLIAGGRPLHYLNKCDPNRRRWEWHYLDRLCHNELRTLTGHTGAAIGVAWSPDGRFVISTGQDCTIRVWDASTGQLVRILSGHTDGVLGVTCSPDGRQIATAGADGIIKLWDPATGAESHTLRGHAKAVTSVAYSPDGTRLVSGSEDGTVRLWEPTTGREREVLTRHDETVSGVAFSPDGRRVASSSWDRRVKVWDLAEGREVFASDPASWVWTGVAFSPDGERLAASGGNGQVFVWRVASHQLLYELRGPGQWIHGLSLSPDGRHLACSAADGAVPVWDVSEGGGRIALVLRGHTRRVNGLAFSPDGRRLVTASTDGTVKLWDVGTNAEETYFDSHKDFFTALAFGPSGRWLVSVGRDGTAHVTDPRTGQRLHSLALPLHEVRSLVVTPDGNSLVTGGGDGLVRVLDSHTGEALRQWQAHDTAVCGLALQAAGRELFTVGTDGTLRYWDLSTGRLLRELPSRPGPLTAAALSPDGYHLATAGTDPQPWIEIAELPSGSVLHRLDRQPGVVTGLALDGRDRLASVASDLTTRLWDLATGQEALAFTRHTQTPNVVAFSPNGHLLATGGQDKSVRVYDGTPR